MIEFVRNYSDLSTDRGYQFKFNCDHCANGYMSSYQPSLIGTAGGLLQAAGSLFGGILGSAGNSSYEIQRAIGGPAHDRALQHAVEEVKQKFRRCQRCGNWVCAEICWNERAAQCTGCTPKYEQEVIFMRTQAQVEATQQQLREKALTTDYVSGVDMNPDAQVQLNSGSRVPQLPAQPDASSPSAWQTPMAQSEPQPIEAPWTPVHHPAPPSPSSSGTLCTACGAQVAGGKFCAECGAPTATPAPKACSACGHLSAPFARFCEECGSKLL